MYSTIPLTETKQILDNTLTSYVRNTRIKSELLNCYEVITEQNYLINNGRIIIQTDGLAIVAPSSNTLSEIFLQHIEHTHLPHLAQKHKLVNYFRYVDGFLLIYDSQHTDIHTVHKDFNSIHQNLQFTQETEQNSTINYLDITIHKTPLNINVSVHSKPTFTDTIIPYTCNHPILHKYAAIIFLYNRLNTYQLRTTEYQHESIIQAILYNNSFPIFPQNPKRSLLSQPEEPLTKQQGITFTYTGREYSHYKIIQTHKLRIACRTNNNLLHHLTQTSHIQDKFTQSGVYKLTCSDCGKVYMGQIDYFKTRFNEHKRSFQYNTQTSK